MRTRSVLLRPAALLACTLALGACAYRNINPEAAAADERADGSSDALRSVTQGTAKLVFRASGAGHATSYAVSTSGEACQGFQSVGNVAYSGRGVVLPWIARMNERTRSAVFKTQPFVEHDAVPGRSIQVRAVGNWQETGGVFNRAGTCGPLVAKFTPVAGRAYLVEFVWRSDNSCSQVVTDSTDPSAPTPVQLEGTQSCDSPGSEGS